MSHSPKEYTPTRRERLYHDAAKRASQARPKETLEQATQKTKPLTNTLRKGETKNKGLLFLSEMMPTDKQPHVVIKAMRTKQNGFTVKLASLGVRCGGIYVYNNEGVLTEFTRYDSYY